MISVFNQYVSVKHILVVCLETIIIVMSVILEAKLRFWNQQPQFLHYTSSSDFLLQILTVFLIIQGCRHDYKLNPTHWVGDQPVRMLQAIGVGYVGMCLLYYVFPNSLLGPGMLLLTLAMATATIMAMRTGLDLFWHVTTADKNVLILGDGATAIATARELERRSDLKMRLVGFLSPTTSTAGALFGHPIVGDKNKLRAVVDDWHVSRIIVALDEARNVLPVRELVWLRIRGVEVEDAQSALAALTGRVWLQTTRPSWFVFSAGFRRSNTTCFIKRFIDVSLSVIGLILFFPLMCLAAIAIWLDSAGPIFYRQVRVGQGGRSFELIKFRSMQLDAEAEHGAQWAAQVDPRATRVGQLLRKYRLDELPQFLNVIRGEMSLVGPRPERPVFVEQLREAIPFYDERHSVRPGVTGWAQVQYPYGSSVEDALRKLEYDLFYLRSLSIAFDIAIILRTVRVVVSGHGR
jgi:sugar transferase (PEP-CTERM system associated)